MKVTQVATILNSMRDEFIGESEPINEDLSNIIDFGRTFTATATDEDTDRFIKKYGDKVAKQIFVSREYEILTPSMVRDGAEWGSVVEKSRFIPNDYENNFVWGLENGHKYDDFLTFKPTSANVKYYNSKCTYKIPLEQTRRQLRESMLSSASFMSFTSALENNILNQLHLAYNLLAERLLNGLIAKRISENNANTTIDLLALYNTNVTPTTPLTQSKAIYDKEFLRFCSSIIMDVSELMKVMSMKYNSDGVMTFTPKEYQSLTLISKFAINLETYLYSDTYHDDFLKIGTYEKIPFWQGIGTTTTFSDRTTIDVKLDDNTTVKRDFIVGILRDRDACVIFNNEQYTTSFVNPDTAVTRYNFMNDISLFSDTSENAVVFTIGTSSI